MKKYDAGKLLRHDYVPGFKIEYAHYLCRESIRAIESLLYYTRQVKNRRRHIPEVEKKLATSSETLTTVVEFLEQVAAIKNQARRQKLEEPLNSLRMALEQAMQLLREMHSGYIHLVFK